jgi:DNA-directed RNA polymerase specialized sigma24 family protein
VAEPSVGDLYGVDRVGEIERRGVVTGEDTRLSTAFAELSPRIRAALTPLADADAVDDAVAEAFEYLCSNADRVLAMDNPGGYLYRVARTRLGRRRRTPVLPPVSPYLMPPVEPGLPAALAALTERQRVAVFLIAGMGWPAGEVADYLDVAETSVRSHYDRGIAKLRTALGEVPE